MANNKVVLADGTTLIDLTADTITADKVMQGYTAHDASGTLITGNIADGNQIGYGLTDGTMPLVGVAKVGQAEIGE